MSGHDEKPWKNVGIIGVPFDKGQKKYGVNLGPAALREAGLVKELEGLGLSVKDYGDIETTSDECGNDTCTPVENMNNLPIVSACNRKLSARVTQVIKDKRVAVSVGGDHSMGIGTVDGHLNAEDCILIWIDAHADINTNLTSGSGSVHGMPVALLSKELCGYFPKMPSMEWHVPKLTLKNVGYIGLRSVDDYERLILKKYEIPAFAMEDVDQYGAKKSIECILNKLDPKKEKPIHVSFDIDSLDPLEAPSTGTPVRGGLTLREGIIIMEHIYATGRLHAIDLVEVNPAVGDAADRARTIEAAIAILKAGLGYERRGTAPPGVNDIPK